MEERERLKRVWSGMVQRCTNPSNTSYHNYGGRGITICSKWLNNRDSFIEWCIDHGSAKGLQIDRENNNGNYEPSNCRWVTPKVNANNRRPHSETKPCKYADRPEYLSVINFYKKVKENYANKNHVKRTKVLRESLAPVRQKTSALSELNFEKLNWAGTLFGERKPKAAFLIIPSSLSSQGELIH